MVEPSSRQRPSIRSRFCAIVTLASTATLALAIGHAEAQEPAPSSPVTCAAPGTWDPAQLTLSCAEAIIAATRVLPPYAARPRSIPSGYGIPCPDDVPVRCRSTATSCSTSVDRGTWSSG